MLELWVLLAVVAWLGLTTLVIALCAASGRADRNLMTTRPGPRTVRRPAHRPSRRLTSI